MQYISGNGTPYLGVKVIQRVLLWMVLSVALTACAIAVPVHEAEPPEVLGNWGFRLGYFAGETPVEATTSNSALSVGEKTTVEGFRVGFGFLDRFQLNADLFAGIADAGTSLALKYQWTGANYFNATAGNSVQTTVLRYWDGSAANFELNDQFQFKYGDLGGSGEDVTHLFGYRPADWFGMYVGPKLMLGQIKVQYKNTDDGPVVETDRRDFWGGGAVGGIFLSPHSRHIGFDLNLEAEVMNLPETYSNDRTWYSTVMLTLALPFSFGG